MDISEEKKFYGYIGEADVQHHHFAQQICDEMAASAKVRGTGIAKRSPELIVEKMRENKAIIAVTSDGKWVGFCYIQAWENDAFVSSSGLIIAPELRRLGVGTAIKEKAFLLARKKYPNAVLFGLTTSAAVMKINSALGYRPVTYQSIPQEPSFWKGCESCVNHTILINKQRQNCLCTAMAFDPANLPVQQQIHEKEKSYSRI